MCLQSFDTREVLLALVLARQVRHSRLVSAPGLPPETGFLSISSLLLEIDRIKAQIRRDDLWQNAIDTDVHKTISSLRRKLDRAGFNRNLIEGKRGLGYRLSIPPWNLVAPAISRDSRSR